MSAGGVAKQAIFVGDSILQWFTRDGAESWRKYFTSTYNCINLGVPGDSTDQTIHRLKSQRLLEHPDILPPTVPKVCTLLVGTNDIGRGQSEAYIAAQTAETIQIVRDKLDKNVKFLLLGIIPRRSLSQKPALINEIIATYDDGDAVRFLDVSNNFCDGKQGKLVLRKELYWSDGLHLTSRGYEVLAKSIEPDFKKLMEETVKK